MKNKKIIKLQLKLILFCILSFSTITNTGYFKRYWTSFLKSTKQKFHRFKKLKFNSKTVKLNQQKLKSLLYKHKKLLQKTAIASAPVSVVAVKELYEFHFGKWGEENHIQDTISYKVAKEVSSHSIRGLLQQLTSNAIKNLDFAMKEITKALRIEKEAEKRKDLALYHVMPPEIFIALSLYTLIYNDLNKKKTDEHLFYLRTHNSVKDLKNVQYGVQQFKEEDIGESKYMMSFNAFLFAGAIIPAAERTFYGESAFTRTIGYNERMGIINRICNDICELYHIDEPECRKEISNLIVKRLYNQTSDEYFNPKSFENSKMILQIMFPKEKNAPTLQDLKNIVDPELDLDNSYVSYDENLVDHPDFYWSSAGTLPCTKVKYGPYYYQGSKMFHILTSSQNEREIRRAAKEAARSQLALIVTPKVLEKQITYDVIDIHNQFSQIEELKKSIHEESLSIIQKYQHTNQKSKPRFWGLFG